MNIPKTVIKHKRTILVFTILLICLSSLGLYFLWYANKTPLQKLANDSTFPIYAPTELPAGYAIDGSSISLTSQALLFTAKLQDDTSTLIFTETPVPAEYDFESFYKTRFVGAQDVSSLYGRGKIGTMDGMMSGSLATDSTWILVKAHENFSASDMKDIIEGLRLVE